MRTRILLAAILAFASVSQAQVNEESRPATPPPALVAFDTSSNSYAPGMGDDCCYTVPLEIDPSSSGSAANTVSAPSGPATAYGHGNGGWVPSSFVSYRKAVAEGRQRLSGAQSKPNAPASASIPDRFRQLVLETRGAQQNAPNSSAPNGQVLYTQYSSLGDIAREARERKAAAPKAHVVVKQDAQGKAVLVAKKPWYEYNATSYSGEKF
ncbi:MAG: hypothetical protein WB780_19825 [Candidatus Acidiferrales bacterium]